MKCLLTFLLLFSFTGVYSQLMLDIAGKRVPVYGAKVAEYKDKVYGDTLDIIEYTGIYNDSLYQTAHMCRQGKPVYIDVRSFAIRDLLVPDSDGIFAFTSVANEPRFLVLIKSFGELEYPAITTGNSLVYDEKGRCEQTRKTRLKLVFETESGARALLEELHGASGLTLGGREVEVGKQRIALRGERVMDISTEEVEGEIKKHLRRVDFVEVTADSLIHFGLDYQDGVIMMCIRTTLALSDIKPAKDFRINDFPEARVCEVAIHKQEDKVKYRGIPGNSHIYLVSGPTPRRIVQHVIIHFPAKPEAEAFVQRMAAIQASGGK